MSPRELTDQEKFWQGQFGSEYTERNSDETQIADTLQTLAVEIKSVQSLSIMY